MKTKSDYSVQKVKVGKRNYYYFRNRASGVRVALDGEPGSREYELSYEAALREHAPMKALPQILRARGAAPGSLAWVLAQYKERSKEWLNAAESTKEIYDRRHHWLIARFGEAMIWDFTREQVKQIRDLKEFSTSHRSPTPPCHDWQHCGTMQRNFVICPRW